MRRAVALAVLAAAAWSAAPGGATAPWTWTSRFAAATRYAETRAGQVSFAVVDESGRLRGYRASAVAPSASVLKAMLLVAYLRKASVRDRPLSRRERDLLGPMIRRSDNDAAGVVLGLVGSTGVYKLARLAGMTRFRLVLPIWGHSEITAGEQARFFYRIDSYVPVRHRAYALRLLARIVPAQRWGIAQVPHPGWGLYFKGGWGSGTGLVDHQVALLAAAGERVSVAILTRSNPSHDYGKETLRGVAVRLLAGIPHPLAFTPRAARVAADRRRVAYVHAGCSSLAIRTLAGARAVVASGAETCAGVRLALSGSRALWSREADGAAWVGSASLAEPTPVQAAGLSYDESGGGDSLRALAGGSGTLAYSYDSYRAGDLAFAGGTAKPLGGVSCPAPERAALSVESGLIAVGAGATVEVRDAATCALAASLAPAGAVRSLALAGDFLAVLTRDSAGAAWIERYRISSETRLGRSSIPAGTLPQLVAKGRWVVYRGVYRLRAQELASGRTWTIWRPRRRPVGPGLAGRRLVWIENGPAHGRLWILPLPR